MSNIRSFHDTSVGTKFLSVNTEDLVDVTSRAAESLGGHMHFIHNRSGALIAQATFEDLSFKLEDSRYLPRLWLKNANNGTSALLVGLGLYRMVCMNGLYFGVSAWHTRMVHRIGQTSDSILSALPDAIAEGVEQIKSGRLEDTVFDASSVQVLNPIQIIGNLPNVGLRVKDATIQSILLGQVRAQDSVNTAWGLYNHVNERVARYSRSPFRAADRDIGMLDEIITLANDQLSEVA